MRGKVALITGSTSGIGLAIATELARQGADILLHGLGPYEKALHELSLLGPRIAYHPADLRCPNQIQELVEFCSSQLGPIDILVNNAGIQFVAPVEQFPTHQWDDVLAVNLSAPFHITRLALPSMRLRNWGRIINIASVHGLVASPLKSAYVAAKHGLVGFTKAVALETASTNVTVNAICPGWVLTPLVQKQIDDRVSKMNISPADAAMDLLLEKQPSLQFVSPQQIADLVVFLCSPHANSIRGAAWNIDGGWLAQ